MEKELTMIYGMEPPAVYFDSLAQAREYLSDLGFGDCEEIAMAFYLQYANQEIGK